MSRVTCGRLPAERSVVSTDVETREMVDIPVVASEGKALGTGNAGETPQQCDKYLPAAPTRRVASLVTSTNQEVTVPRKSTKQVAPEFQRTRDFIRKYTVLGEDELDVVTVWAMGTWTFSPAAPASPATYPYLYVAGPKGSGKTVLGQDVFGSICRSHENVVGATGAALFRMLGDYDDESGEITPHWPTLSIDEIDATYSGAKDESLRQVLNAGYKRGSTVPRAAGKVSLRFPVYCPKCLMGIDNGHLPDTVQDRSIRIDMHRATREERATLEPFYSFEVEDDAAELSETLSQWAKANAMVLRDYRPKEIEGLSPRQWEIARTLVQLAHALGNEDRIRKALHALMTKTAERPDHKVLLYRSIMAVFQESGQDRVTTRMILERLMIDGISVPGNSGKGLSVVVGEDGVEADYIRLRSDHPGFIEGKPIQRGYYLHKFDDAFAKYLASEDEDE